MTFDKKKKKLVSWLLNLKSEENSLLTSHAEKLDLKSNNFQHWEKMNLPF